MLFGSIIGITSATDIGIIIMILIKLFGIKEKAKYTIMHTIFSAVIGVFLVMLELYCIWNNYIYLHGIDMLFLVAVLYSIFFVKGIFFSKITIITVISCSLATIYNLSYYLCICFFYSLSLIPYLIINFFITRLFLILITCIILKYKIKAEYKLPFYYWCILILIPILNFCVSFILEHANISPYTFACMLVAMLIMNMLLYASFSKIVGDYEDKLFYLMDKQYLQLQLQSYEETKKAFYTLNGFRHDLKNHMLCMRIMINNSQFDKLKNYFFELDNEMSNMMTQVKTGNVVIDTVINSKAALAYSYKIPFHTQVSNPIEITMKDFEICSILSNLIDNAIEASNKIKDPEVKVKITSLGDCSIILISNRAEEDVLLKNPNLITTKKDKVNHGIGISAVDSIVKKYGGMLSFYMDKGYFNANVVIFK